MPTDSSMKTWMSQNQLRHNLYIGMKHFDWTVIASHKGSVAVTLLRNPIERAISHFHFMKVRSLFSLLMQLNEMILT